MSYQELIKDIMSKKFTHTVSQKLDPRTKKPDGYPITQRIIGVNSEGVHTIHFLSKDLKIFRRFPKEGMYKMEEGLVGYVEKVDCGRHGVAYIRVEFVNKLKDKR